MSVCCLPFSVCLITCCTVTVVIKGKAGWISETNDSWLRFKADQTPWMAYGYRKLRLHIGYMQTYANAGVFKITYCNKVISYIDTYWNDTVSLLTHASFELPTCDLLHNIGHVVFRHVLRREKEQQDGARHKGGGRVYASAAHTNMGNGRAAGKVKLVSVALCPQTQLPSRL